jgi:hypothetical protein
MNNLLLSVYILLYYFNFKYTKFSMSTGPKIPQCLEASMDINTSLREVNNISVALGGLVVILLTLDLRFAGSNPAIKIRSTTSFGRNIKPSRRSHVVRFYGMLKSLQVLKRYFVEKIEGHFSSRFSCFATRCLCWSLAVSSGGLLRNDKKLDEEAEVIAVLETPCAIPPRNCNSNSTYISHISLWCGA